LAAVVVASLLPFFQFEMLWIIIAAGLFGAAIILPLGVELLIQRKQFNLVKYLLNVFVPYFAVGVVLIGLALGVQIAVNASYLIQVSIPTGISLFYIGLFAVVPYLGHRTGAVLSAFDVITRTNERLFAKRLRTSDRPDRLTLYEKWTKYITPKCFRNDL